MIDGLRPYPEYKDSGIPWLGKVPAHWGLERAKNLFSKMERPPEPGDEVVTCFRDGTVTLRKNRRITGFTESLKEIGYQGVRRGELVIHAMDAFAGAVGVSDSNGKCTPVYAICRPRGDANPHYYAYIVREMARTQWIAALAKGIRERSTDFRYSGFASQLIPFPERTEQATIAKFLGDANRRIERLVRAKKKLIALLNEQKQAIIQQAVTRGLDPNIRFKPSSIISLEEMPGHWDVISIRQIAASGRSSIANGPFGSSLLTTELKSEGVPVIYIRDISTGRYRRVSKSFVTIAKAHELQFCRVHPGDILIAKVGDPPGTSAVYPVGEPEGLVTQDVIRLRPNTKIADPHYITTLLNSPFGRNLMGEITVESTRGRFPLPDFKSLVICLPPLEEQKRIQDELVDLIAPIASVSSRYEQEIDLLQEYRTRLIAEIVTGQLDVREASRHLPDEPEGPEPFDATEETPEDFAEIDAFEMDGAASGNGP